MSTNCIAKQNEIKELFIGFSAEEKYKKIMDMGRKLPILEDTFKIPENIVKGCQSTMYLRSYMKEGNLFFEVYSEALISAGLASLLIYVYNGEKPETILTCPPDFLEDLGLSASLTPSRANGLYSVHLRMKQEALKHLISK